MNEIFKPIKKFIQSLEKPLFGPNEDISQASGHNNLSQKVIPDSEISNNSKNKIEKSKRDWIMSNRHCNNLTI